MMGPVDYLVVLFPGNKFHGKIAPEIANLESSGIIKVIDLIMITKDAHGHVGMMEVKNLTGEVGDAYRRFAHNIKDWLSLDDIEAIGESLPNNCSAAALLFENVWARKLKDAMVQSDVVLLTQGRIPHEVVMAVMKERITPGGA